MATEGAFLYFNIHINICKNVSICRVCICSILSWVCDFRNDFFVKLLLQLFSYFAALGKVGYIVKKLFLFEQLQVILPDGCCWGPICKLATDHRRGFWDGGSLCIITLEFVKIKMILLCFEKFQTFHLGFESLFWIKKKVWIPTHKKMWLFGVNFRILVWFLYTSSQFKLFT
jgi:hypothetical protein